MKKITYLIVLSLALMFTGSCSSDDDAGSDVNDPALVGSWGASETGDGITLEVTVTFNSNQSGRSIITTTFEGETESETENFTWSTVGNRLTIKISGEDDEVLTYSISGNRLTLTDSDGFSTVLTKL